MEMHAATHPAALLKEWLAQINATAAQRLGVSRLSLSKVAE